MLRWVYERTAISAGQTERFQIMEGALKALSQQLSPTVNLGVLSNRCTDAVYEYLCAGAKHYDSLKLKSNRAARELMAAASGFIEEGRTPRERFERAFCLAAAGNVAPIGAPSDAFKFQEVENIIGGRDPLPALIGDIFGAAQRATHVLYVADNAGEIGFDSLVMAMLKQMGLNITLIVKESPFFDDCTPLDASFFDLDKLADNILTVRGIFVPKQDTQPLRDPLNKSDLLIAKGTGNYEALKGEVKGIPTLYMLKIKCGPIAEAEEANIGSFIVKLEK
jgi:uncharacterized protein with ATP-grasp and redox domains